MGWFSSEPSGPSGPAPKPSSDGAYEAPDRTRRAQCWDSRDLFFGCLDKNDILDAVKDKSKAEQLCKEEHAEFQKNCASSWVCLDDGAWPKSALWWVRADKGLHRSNTLRRSVSRIGREMKHCESWSDRVHSRWCRRLSWVHRYRSDEEYRQSCRPCSRLAPITAILLRGRMDVGCNA